MMDLGVEGEHVRFLGQHNVGDVPKYKLSIRMALDGEIGAVEAVLNCEDVGWPRRIDVSGGCRKGPDAGHGYGCHCEAHSMLTWSHGGAGADDGVDDLLVCLQNIWSKSFRAIPNHFQDICSKSFNTSTYTLVQRKQN